MNEPTTERMDGDTYRRMEEMFAEGYRAAKDRLVYLRLAGIPFDLPQHEGPDAPGRLHLRGIRIDEAFEVGSVTPAFGDDRLVHQMYPHDLVERRMSLRFVYVHHDRVVEKSLRELLGLVVEQAHDHN